ncbi:hypothetical protein [Algoriphagus sp.]|uniref:hypothetical protein n=1 Tax=Algoriphagus sp. TaxID=1872435 RepID=UPI00391BD2B5
MKKFLLIILITLWAGLASAQFAENNSLYLGLGPTVGNYSGLDINFNYAFQRSWSAQIGIKTGIRGAKNKPDDFSGGILGLLTRGLTNPKDEITSYQFLVGKMILLDGDEGSFRLNLLTGPSINRFRNSVNFQRVTDAGVILGTYTFQSERDSGIGWMVKPTFEIPLGKVVGFGFSPYANFNSKNMAYGFDIQLLLGVLQPSRKSNSRY